MKKENVMPCYHPLKGFPIGVTSEGKQRLKVTSYDVEKVDYLDDEHFPRVTSDFIPIPCGQCTGCRLDYARQWADRCLMELQYHDSAYFVTLTYNNDFLPVSEALDDVTGQLYETHTLRKEDLQKFFKRLRKAFPDDDIRYYCCGEYGPQTYRPHYHAIIFGLHLNDLKLCGKNEIGQNYYSSDMLQRVWSKFNKDTKEVSPFGNILVADVTYETCAYTARYVMKKLKGKAKSLYDELNIEPEFTLMSRKPGIGRQFYEDNKEKLYRFDRVSLSTPTGGKIIHCPRYFDNLYDLDNHYALVEKKEFRKKMAEELVNAKMDLNSVSYLELLRIEEDALKSRIRSLKRDKH